MNDRYNVSKLLEIFGVRAFAERYPSRLFPVTVNLVNPGFCHSELAREAGWAIYFLKVALARSTEYGSRTLIHATSLGQESHGQYLHDCKISQPSSFVLGDEGKKAQDCVWDEMVNKLEAIKPGITTDL
ncbi:hypothetical protein BP5796_04356 [Coleophoma crateriformis]|uniref:Uncharacterized protein n=1 Tax=Coleophoma crateriformis TaxID=565419 RepID=A0A3D8SIM6_9HELO|nr:hypothetical protein BP5796_04356 [Coleophoma crateriformis]